MQVLVNYKRKWCSFKYSVQLLAVWVVYSTAPVNNRHDEEFQPEGYCAALRRHPRDFEDENCMKEKLWKVMM
jgi:hypothetical protein